MYLQLAGCGYIASSLYLSKGGVGCKDSASQEVSMVECEAEQYPFLFFLIFLGAMRCQHQMLKKVQIDEDHKEVICFLLFPNSCFMKVMSSTFQGSSLHLRG